MESIITMTSLPFLRIAKFTSCTPAFYNSRLSTELFPLLWTFLPSLFPSLTLLFFCPLPALSRVNAATAFS